MEWVLLMGLIKKQRSTDLTKGEQYIFGFSSLLIFIAWDGCFNMQVLTPVAVFLAFRYFTGANGRSVDLVSARLILLLAGSASFSLLISLFITPEVISMQSIGRLLYTVFIIIFFVIMTERKYNISAVRRVLLCNIISGAVLGLSVFVRHLSGATGKIGVLTIWGVQVEQNYMSALLCFDLVLSLIMVFHTKEIIRKGVLLAFGCCIFLGIFYSGSRAAMLGSILSVALLLLYYLFSGSAKYIVFRLLTVAAIIMLIAFAALLFNADSASWYIERFFQNDYNDMSNQYRLQYWRFGVMGILYRPLFGYGIGNFNYFVREELGSFHGDVVVAHNTYIDYLLDIGVVGTALLAVLVLRKVWSRNMFRSGELTALMFAAFFTSFIVGGERTFFFWNSLVLLSMIASVGGKEAIPILLDWKRSTG